MGIIWGIGVGGLGGGLKRQAGMRTIRQACTQARTHARMHARTQYGRMAAGSQVRSQACRHGTRQLGWKEMARSRAGRLMPARSRDPIAKLPDGGAAWPAPFRCRVPPSDRGCDSAVSEDVLPGVCRASIADQGEAIGGVCGRPAVAVAPAATTAKLLPRRSGGSVDKEGLGGSEGTEWGREGSSVVDMEREVVPVYSNNTLALMINHQRQIICVEDG